MTMTSIKLPTKLNLDWNNFEWEITTGFSLVGNRCVYRELYKEYEVESIEQALDNLEKDASVLVHYHFKPINFSTVFRIYAVAHLFSNRCTYKDREMVEGETIPFNLILDDTFFEIWNEPHSASSINSYKYLRCGGMNKKNAKKNWVQVSNFCREYFEN